ncbi:hypothetical protein Droror1_Dr00019983 [Drosera rotundifolia]
MKSSAPKENEESRTVLEADYDENEVDPGEEFALDLNPELYPSNNEGKSSNNQYRSNLIVMLRIIKDIRSKIRDEHRVRLQKTPFWPLIQAMLDETLDKAKCWKNDIPIHENGFVGFQFWFCEHTQSIERIKEREKDLPRCVRWKLQDLLIDVSPLISKMDSDQMIKGSLDQSELEIEIEVYTSVPI